MKDRKEQDYCYEHFTKQSVDAFAEAGERAQSQIDFFEAQKANLKNMKCETLEEIGRKLELFNNYNAQIMAVKQQYNQEQMMHTMDEAREFGEKIAEAAEKLEAKTPEERKREQIEEALGIEDEDGLLTEVLEESLDKMILLEEELAEEVSEEDLENMESMENAEMVPGIVQQEELTQEYLETKYTPFDMKA